MHVPDFMLEEAGIDDSNGLISYIDGNSIVIIEADEDEDYGEYNEYDKYEDSGDYDE